MKKLMVANWKMNKTVRDITEFFEVFESKFSQKREAWIAPQSIHASLVKQLGIKKNIQVGAQNTSQHVEGAFTGELSPRSFKSLGGDFTILGHSERRQYFSETSKELNSKVRTALNEKLMVIYCVGETLKEREANQTLRVISEQLQQGLGDLSMANEKNLLIAYEPVWAIGTGKTATPTQAQEVHAFIRETLSKMFPSTGKKMRILYGGSVKPDNVEELLGQKDIDGGLVGGASLKPRDFLALCGDK